MRERDMDIFFVRYFAPFAAILSVGSFLTFFTLFAYCLRERPLYFVRSLSPPLRSRKVRRNSLSDRTGDYRLVSSWCSTFNAIIRR